jgi:hypothetical protein
MTNSSDLIKNTIWYQMKQIKTDWFYGTLLIDKNNKNEKRYRLLITIVFGVIGLLIDIDICKYLDKLTPLAGSIMGWLISGAKESRPCFLKDTESLDQIKKTLPLYSVYFTKMKSIFDKIHDGSLSEEEAMERYTEEIQSIETTQMIISESFGSVDKKLNDEAKVKCDNYLRSIYKI